MPRLDTFVAGTALLFSLLPTRPASAQTYQVDRVHSSVLFQVKYANASHLYIFFRDFGGSFTIDETDLARSSVRLEIKMASVDSIEDKRTQHLKSPDFFNVKQFPTANFKSTRVEKAGTGYRVSGDFTLKGVTRPIAVEIVPVGKGKDGYGNTRAGYDAQFTIKRSDFGVNYMPDGVGDDVIVIVTLSGIQQ